MSEIKCWAHEIREPGCPKCCSESEAATQPDKLVVTQEARDAALSAASASLGERLDLAATRAGEQDDHPLVQAFQRAMNQAADERQEMCARLVENWPVGAESKNDALANAAKAIRSIGKGGM